MNISVNTSTLARKLRFVEKIVSQKSIIPIMSNVLLRAELGELRLSTTNLEVSLTTACPAVINTPGVITAPVKTLLDVVNLISDDTTHLTLEKSHVRISAAAFKMRVSALASDDFPTLPTVPAGGVLLSGEVFRTMIRRVRYAISDADKRYFMNGALLSLTATATALITTDGKRLALTATARGVPGDGVPHECFEILIPTKTLDVLLSDDSHDDMLFHHDARQMFFVSDDTILTSRTVDGAFPNYKRIIPVGNSHVATLPRAPLLAALRRVALAAGDASALSLSLAENSLTLSSADALVGDATEHLTIEYVGPPMKIAFDWHYLADFLNAATSPTVQLALKDGATASRWTDGTELMNVIMPIRG